MGRGEHTVSDLLIYGIAFSIAAAIALTPQKASSGSYDTAAPVPAGPRWSNDHQIADSVIAGPDCVELAPGQSANYVPGRDAWGRPVAPADGHTGYATVLPSVEVEIQKKKKKHGSRAVTVHTGPMYYDPLHNTLSGYPVPRDCAARVK